jgi:predicted Zn-dependent peptidase
MQEQHISAQTFENGLTLLVETMTSVQSAAFSILVPAGSVYEPLGQNGTCAILSDLITRGAGDYDSRELLAILDTLGVQGHESPNNSFLTLSGATLAANMPEVIRIYADVLLRPHLPADQFEAARMGVTQSLRAIEDEPQQKLMPELKRRAYEVPWGLPPDGTLADLPLIPADSVREHYDRCIRPNGTILAVAGNVDVREIQGLVRECFGDWMPKPEPTYETSPTGPMHDHIMHDSEQTHIGIAYNGSVFSDPDYYEAWAAACVLGHGMSSRLFSEVREKRGLCYSVSATLTGFKHEGRMICYAGTTNERAQQTLDVTLEEVFRLKDGITENELERCKAMAKSSLIMQQESTRGRARTMAAHWHHLGRVVTLDEVRQKIDALSVKSIQDFLDNHPPEGFTILTIGPDPLEIRRELS